MEDTMPCPGCKSPQDGGIHEGYRHYECGSFSHANGECLQPSKACKRLARAMDVLGELMVPTNFISLDAARSYIAEVLDELSGIPG